MKMDYRATRGRLAALLLSALVVVLLVGIGATSAYAAASVTPIVVEPSANGLQSVAIAPNGTIYTVAESGYIYKIVGGVSTMFTGAGWSPYGDSIGVSPDGSTLYLGNHDNGYLQTISTTDGSRGVPITIPGESSVQALAVAPNGTIFVIAGSAYKYKIASGVVTQIGGTGGSPFYDSLAVSPDGTTLYVGTQNDGAVLTFSATDGSAGPTIATGLGAGQVNAVALSPGGHTLYVGTQVGGNILAFATVGGTPETSLASGAPWFNALAAGSDGTLAGAAGNGYLYEVVDNYGITFNPEGGSYVAPIIQAYDTVVSAPAAPTRPGYTFGGWYSDLGLTMPYTFTTMPDTDATLYAKWIANYYDISFVSNGGTSVSTLHQPFGSVVSSPADPTRTGYTFGGWYSDPGLTLAYTFPATMPDVNTMAYAKWTPIPYTISFNSEGGSMVTAISQSFGTPLSAPAAPTWAGHTFAGWYMDSSLTLPYPFPATMPASSFTLYAAWNSSNYVITPVVTTAPGIQALVVSPNGTTVYAVDSDGYVDTIVSGVVTHRIGTGESPYGDTLAISPDGLTLYVGTANDGNILTLDTTSLTWGTPVPTDTRSRQYSQIAALAMAPDGTLYAANVNGYTYKIVSGAVVSQIAAGGAGWGDSLAISPGGHTLYVGTGNDGNVQTIDTTSWTLGAPIVLGTPFIDALAEGSNGTLYAGGSNGTVYAIVDARTIMFDSNGGTAVTSITQGYDTTVAAPTSPTKTGNTFAGWYSDAALTTPYTFTTMPDSDITLYAKWTVNNYTITFVSNGGSAVTPITQAFGSTVSAPAAPTRTGYAFAGWYSDSALTLPYTFTTMPAGSSTLYAKWTLNAPGTFTLSYTPGLHGSIVGSSTQVVNSGSDGTAVTAVAATFYHFVSWSDGVTTATRTDTNVTASKSLTANFALNVVAKSLTINGPSRAKHGYAFKLYGKVTPALEYMQITRYRKNSKGRWVSYGRYNIVGRADSTWYGNVSTNQKGSWKFTIACGGLSKTKYVTAY